MVQHGETGFTAEMESYLLVQPLDFDARLFLPYKEIFKYLNLEKPGKRSGTAYYWIDHSREAWSSLFTAAFDGHDQIILNTYMSESSRIKVSLAFPQRCLPETSVSLLGLLYQLARWSTKTCRTGGLAEPGRSNARVLLGKLCCMPRGELLAQCSASSKWVIHCEVAHEWKCRWPRPPPYGAMTVKIEVEAGLADFSLLERLARGENEWAKAVWKSLS